MDTTKKILSLQRAERRARIIARKNNFEGQLAARALSLAWWCEAEVDRLVEEGAIA